MLVLALKYLKLIKFISVICDTQMNNEKLWRKILPLNSDLSMHSDVVPSIVSSVNSMLFAFMCSCNCDIIYSILLLYFHLPLYHKHFLDVITTLHKVGFFFDGYMIVS